MAAAAQNSQREGPEEDRPPQPAAPDGCCGPTRSAAALPQPPLASASGQVWKQGPELPRFPSPGTSWPYVSSGLCLASSWDGWIRTERPGAGHYPL